MIEIRFLNRNANYTTKKSDGINFGNKIMILYTKETKTIYLYIYIHIYIILEINIFTIVSQIGYANGKT